MESSKALSTNKVYISFLAEKKLDDIFMSAIASSYKSITLFPKFSINITPTIEKFRNNIDETFE
jgi:hypothetical protein